MARMIDAIELRQRMCALCNQDYSDEPCEPSDCVFVRAINEAPTLTPPNEPERAGLYGKYTVRKNSDGSLVTDCFVLRPNKDLAAVVALRAYATATDNAELAADIISWVGAESNEPLTLDELMKMDGQPVWIKRLKGSSVCDTDWAVVEVCPNKIRVWWFGSEVEDEPSEKDYGETWLAYRRPPEGEA